MNNIIFKNQYLFIFTDKNKYVRIIQKTGGVVIIPTYKEKYALIVHLRGQEEFIEFPRGFLESGESHILGGERELKEELNLISINSYLLGDLVTDSGLIDDNIKAIVCELKDPCQLLVQSSEGIVSCNFYTFNEILTLIKIGKIKDNYTLASLILLYAKTH